MVIKSYYMNPMKTKGFTVPTDSFAWVKFQFRKLLLSLLFQKMPICCKSPNLLSFGRKMGVTKECSMHGSLGEPSGFSRPTPKS